MGKQKYFLTEETIQQIIADRKVGMIREDICEKYGLNLNKFKDLMREREIKVDPAIGQANAMKRKLEKNPNALNEMRSKITKESHKKASETAKLTWSDPELKNIVSERSKEWWKGLSKEQYQAECDARKGDKSGRTKGMLSKNNATTSTELMNMYARTFGGEFIDTYKGSKEKVKWKCHLGHVFEAIPNSVQQNHWCNQCVHHVSTAQQEIQDFVIGLGVQTKTSIRSVIAPLEIDIWCPDQKLAIEYNGLYWHSEIAPGYVSGKHYKKYELCKQAGVNLLALYEDDWRDKKELCKAMIKWRLKKFDGIKIGARKCVLKKLEHNNEFKSFFERNHLDGHAQSMYAYGLFFQNQMIMCTSFRKHQQTGLLEIARMAQDYNYCVAGGASKLLSQIKESLITYSNNRLSHGEVYSKLGFKEDTQTEQSGYWYTDMINRYSRHLCRKINDVDVLSKFTTEKDQAHGGVFGQKLFGESRPLFKIEDYGNRRWIK